MEFPKVLFSASQILFTGTLPNTSLEDVILAHGLNAMMYAEAPQLYIVMKKQRC